MVVRLPGGRLVTEEEAKRLYMRLIEDDTEDAPWMVMGSLQWAAASDFFQSLREYAERNRRPWFVAGMTPILYRWEDNPRKKQLAPDVFVAFGPDRPRSSFDLEVEGDFPPFVLEVVSPSSADRDRTEKRDAYEVLGGREYALFTPEADLPSTLEGYRRGERGTFEPWPKDDHGRLWSEVLGLYLLPQDTTIRAATRDGHLLPTLSESEAENERLRREIEELRRQLKPR